MYIHFECILCTVYCILNSPIEFLKSRTNKNVLDKNCMVQRRKNNRVKLIFLKSIFQDYIKVITIFKNKII